MKRSFWVTYKISSQTNVIDVTRCVLFNVLFNYLVWEYSKVVDQNWLHFLFLPWKIASKLLTIHYLSVQLSMITGKGFILEASWLATHLLDKRSRELFTFCARNYCKATFSHAIRVSLFQVVHWCGGGLLLQHSRPPEWPKLMGLKELGRNFS